MHACYPLCEVCREREASENESLKVGDTVIVIGPCAFGVASGIGQVGEIKVIYGSTELMVELPRLSNIYPSSSLRRIPPAQAEPVKMGIIGCNLCESTGEDEVGVTCRLCGGEIVIELKTGTCDMCEKETTVPQDEMIRCESCWKEHWELLHDCQDQRIEDAQTAGEPWC